MSTLLERIAAKSQSLTKRKPVDLPNYGETVTVRTLSQGAVMRANAEGDALRVSAMIAFCVEDPATGELVFNWNDLAHRQIIFDLDPADTALISNTVAELSGMGEPKADLLGKLVPRESFSISSPPVTESPPANLQSDSTAGSS